MLKQRLIPMLLLDGGRLVKSVGFGPGRDVGHPVKSAQVYNDQNADELLFLNVSRSQRGIAPLLDLIEAVGAVCFMPLTVGGGITSATEAGRCITEGADKVLFNSICYRDLQPLRAFSGDYGRQAAVVGIDVRTEPDGWSLWSDCGRRREHASLLDHARRVIDAGAGELVVQCINRDGAMAGYDLDLLRMVAEAVPVPVIGAGGAGTYEHLREAFAQTPVRALAMGSLFHFGDNNPLRAKAHLTHYGIPCKVM